MRPYILAGIIILILAVAGGVWYFNAPAVTPTGELSAEGTTTTTVPVSGSPVVSPAPAATKTPAPAEETGTLQLTYQGTQLAPIPMVTRKVAQSLCGLVFGDSCTWNGIPISQKFFYIYGSAATQPLITITYPSAREVLQYGTPVPVAISDPGPAGQYRVYLIHRSVIGEIDEVHEAHIVSVSGDATKTLVWDGNEVSLDSHGVVQSTKLPKGHYELTVANVDTGVEGGLPSYIQTIDTSKDLDLTDGGFKAYAANTPLVNSYWDGRGVFDDAGPGEDFIDLFYKRSDIVVFRGVDMPDKNQYLTLVFFRRGGDKAVIITTNVETIKFADQTVRATDLIAQLANGQ